MLSCLVAFMTTVREKKFVAMMESESAAMGISEEPEICETGEKRKLSSAEMRSLILILSSVVLWFFGYNAITSKYSVPL